MHWREKIAELFELYLAATRAGDEEAAAAAASESQAVMRDMADGLADAVADLLRAQRGEDVW